MPSSCSPEKTERAACGASVVVSGDTIPTCPICNRPLTGRQTSACSDRCRAAKSRRRRIPVAVEDFRKLRALLDKYLAG